MLQRELHIHYQELKGFWHDIELKIDRDDYPFDYLCRAVMCAHETSEEFESQKCGHKADWRGYA